MHCCNMLQGKVVMSSLKQEIHGQEKPVTISKQGPGSLVRLAYYKVGMSQHIPNFPFAHLCPAKDKICPLDFSFQPTFSTANHKVHQTLVVNPPRFHPQHHHLYSNRSLMATFASLPTEIFYMILSQVSYRDRARMAVVNRICRDIADDGESYRVQYMRDFGDPAGHCFYTGSRIVEEVSWKIAYERRHFADMPLLVQDRLSNSPCH